jgi:hypothetical protein
MTSRDTANALPTPPFGASVAARCAAIGVMGAVVAIVLAIVAGSVRGEVGVSAALLAVGVCCGGLFGAAVFRGALGNDELGVGPVLGGFFFRMALPLAACAAVGLRGGWLLDAGFVIWTLAAYLILLAGDTIFDVRRLAALEHRGA